ncbi:MAG: universal stress protein [Desulfosudaceae bacterium]
MVEIKKILFPVDLTENYTKILPYVLSLAEKYNSQIYLLHVVENIGKWGIGYLPHTSMKKFQEEAQQGAEKALDKICTRDMQSCPNFKRMLISGDPATEILQIIESEEIDMVIMGTHGRKGLEHAIFGSVADNVVKKSPVPVTVVNPHRRQ